MKKKPFFDRDTMGAIGNMMIIFGVFFMWFGSYAVQLSNPAAVDTALELFVVGKRFVMFGLGIRVGLIPGGRKP